MRLTGQTYGSGPHATFLHGFSQTCLSWLPIIHHLEPHLSCTLFDAPGHGDSPDGERSLKQCGNDVAESMRPGILVGYSMGARMALHTALQHPELVNQLVLVSGTAGITNDTERQQRITSDTVLASRIEEIGVPLFIDEWLLLPMFSGLTDETAQRADRLRNTKAGLAQSLRHAGTGTQAPLWDRLHELQMPVLIIAGENDSKFAELAWRMAQYITDSTVIIIEKAGHSVHLEATTSFVEAVLSWLYDTNAIAKPAP